MSDLVQPDWERCRRDNGTIDLQKAAKSTGCYISEYAYNYLAMVERLARITSRQIASVALASALEISARDT